MGIGWTELLVIFLVALLLFGARRIPEIARSLGQAAREFKNAKDQIISEVKAEPAKPETEPETKPEAGSEEKPETSGPDDKQA